MDGGGGGGGGGGNGKEKEEKQDGISAHSPCRAHRSSDSSLSKEKDLLELAFSEALAIYHPRKLQGRHASPLRHVWSDGISAEKVVLPQNSAVYTPFVMCRLNRHFSPDEVLQLMARFYNNEGMDPDDQEIQEEDFSLPQSYFVKEE